jgi:thioredoxin-like negative regulator of GroEL
MTRPVVACLCAAWCDTCGAWRAHFERVAAASPQFAFRWIDIEDEAELLGDIDVENFPTVLIARAGEVLFAGTLRPDPAHLQRVLDVIASGAALAPPANLDAWRALARRLAGIRADPD